MMMVVVVVLIGQVGFSSYLVVVAGARQCRRSFGSSQEPAALEGIEPVA